MNRLPVRRPGLLVRALGAETVVVDPADNTAHALSPVAASVFALCDSGLTVDAAAAALSLSLAEVESAVATLASLGLVTGPGMTRRTAIRRASLIGGGALVATVAAPLAAAHASGPGGGTTTSQYSLNTAGQFNTDRFGLATLAGPDGTDYTPVTDPYTATPGMISNPPPQVTANPGAGTATGVVYAAGAAGFLPFFLGDATPDYFTGFGTVFVPAGAIVVHPGNGPAIIRFANTFRKDVTISTAGTATRTDTGDGNGNGVNVTITRTGSNTPVLGTQNIATTYGKHVDLGTAAFTLADGESLDLVIDDAGALNSNSTLLDYTVTVTA